MSARLARYLGLSCLLFSLQFLNVSCSSSSSGDAQKEEVATNEEGGNETNTAEGNSADNNALANGAENGAQAGAAENNALGNNGLNEGGNGVAANNGGKAGGEEDLQQIIEEMNTANTQLPGQANAGNPASAGAGLNSVPAEGNSAAIPAAALNAAGSAPSGAGSSPATAGTPAGPGLPEIGSKMSYIVQKGDTLAKIAQRIFGEGNKWTEIANFSGLANPRLIYPGDVVYYQLTEQSMKFAGTYESAKRSEVQIKQGDTLAAIAGRVFGNSSLWKLIWRQNDRIDNPDHLTAGTTIYYIDPQLTAAVAPSKNLELAKTPVPSDSKSAAIKSNPAKPIVYEVANDHFANLFTQTLTKEVLKRS